MNIVVCDDSATIRMVIVDCLRQLGLEEVTECGNGRDALALCKTGKVDVLLIDIHMPEMDGMQCVEEVRSNSGDMVTTIFISSDTDPAQFLRAKELGAFGFIKKPFRVQGVKRAMEAAVRETQKRNAERNEEEPSVAVEESPPESKGGMLGWLRKVFPVR